MSTYDDKLKVQGLKVLVGIAELDCKLNMIIKHLGINENDYPEESEGIKKCGEQLASLSSKEKEIYEQEERVKNMTPEEMLNTFFGLNFNGEERDGQ